MYNPEEECKKLIESLNKLCKLSGKSQYALAKTAGISISTLNNLLTGKTSPYVYTLFKLCNAFEVSVGELLSLQPCDSDDFEINQSERELVCFYRHLSDSKKHQMHIFMEALLRFDGEP